MHKRKAVSTDLEPVVLTIPEVAALLRVGTTKVYELIKQEGLPAVPLGAGETLLRVYVTSLHRWLQGRELVGGMSVATVSAILPEEPMQEKRPTPLRRRSRKVAHS